MEEIWKMQRTLNEFCFAKRAIGDYDRVIRDGGAVWLPNFCRAMLHELAEYCEWMDASERRSENEAEARNKRADAAVEAIDILHFLASAGHCADFDGIGAAIAAVEAFSSPCRPWRVVSMEFFKTTCRLEDRAHWKWWSDREIELDVVGARPILRELVGLWVELALEAGIKTMSMAEQLYRAKNAVNRKRQVEGYSEDTKTEEDNTTISKRIVQYLEGPHD